MEKPVSSSFSTAVSFVDMASIVLVIIIVALTFVIVTALLKRAGFWFKNKAAKTHIVKSYSLIHRRLDTIEEQLRSIQEKMDSDQHKEETLRELRGCRTSMLVISKKITALAQHSK